MIPNDLRAHLRAALEPDPSPEPPPGTRLAGVLVPVILAPEPTLIFTRRAEGLSRHAGEISFPGGLPHEGDPSLAATALRESEEELGIASGSVELLGALPAIHTFVSAILIVPFVGALEADPVLRPNAGEIAEVLRYRLEDLDAAEALVELPVDAHLYRGHAYEMGPHTIWGATARILHDLLEALRRVPT